MDEIRLIAWEDCLEKTPSVSKRPALREILPCFGAQRATILISDPVPAPRVEGPVRDKCPRTTLPAALLTASHSLVSRDPFMHDDGLVLHTYFISLVLRCVLPHGMSMKDEIENCQPFLAEQTVPLKKIQVIIALRYIGCKGGLNILFEHGRDIAPR
jgi:hypothetical protein